MRLYCTKVLFPPEAGKPSKKLAGKGLIFRSLRRGSLFILIFLMGVSVQYCSAKEILTTTQIESLIRKANGYLEKDHLDDAKNIFKEVLKSNKNNVKALQGMGTFEFKKKSWGDAKDWYEKILDQNPDDLDAHYHIGICQREIGKYLVLLQRYFAWRGSKKHFEHVFQSDSTYKDILYQWAMLERYRRNYQEAIRMVHRQLAIHNDLSNVQIGIFRFYEYYLNDTDAADVEGWLLDRSISYDVYFLGELYRMNEEFELADSIFNNILSNAHGILVQPIYLSKVKLQVQTDKPDQAAETYWKCVYSVSNRTEAEFILTDLYSIVNGKEYQFYKKNLSSGMFKSAVRIFWRQRNPMPASSFNHRLIEHYRRLVYAKNNYYYDGIRNPNYTNDKTHILETPPWYSENYKYNDQGLIYIRFGEPDETAFALDKDIHPMMSWLYYAKGDLPKMIYHFSVPGGAPPGFWKLDPGYFETEHASMIEQMLHWDNRFQRVMLGDEMERSALAHEMSVERAKNVDTGFKSDRHSWKKNTETIKMNHSLVQFRESDDEDLIQLAYAIPLTEIFPKDVVQDSVLLETGVAVFDQNMNLVHEETRTFSLNPAADPKYWNYAFIDEFEFPIKLKHHNIAFHAQLLKQHKLNGWRFARNVSQKSRENLALSSLKLAYEVSQVNQEGGRDRENLQMIPSVDKVFRKEELLYTYFEIYNLAYDTHGDTRYTVNFILKQISDERNFFQKLGGLFGRGKDYRVSVQSEHIGDSRDLKDFISFDLSKAKKGAYELELTVFDNVTGIQVKTSSDLYLK